MTSRRADPFDIDLSGFAPKPAEKPATAPIKQVSEANAFPSRAAPSPNTLTSQPRRRRTGRNVQLNVKATPDTIARFTALSDAQGWAFGETLEHAVEALEHRLLIREQSRP